MKRIDLFKLHDSKDGSKSLIVAKGKMLRNEIKNIISEIEKTGMKKTELVKLLMKKMKISIVTAERLVYLDRECESIKRKWFPLIFIREIISLIHSDKYFKIQDKIDLLRIGNSSSKPIKPPKRLSKTLCKIAGAHAADGTLFQKDRCGIYISIVDQHKESVQAFIDWIYVSFGLRFQIKKSKNSKNMWYVSFHNKIIGRYLMNIFDFPSGNKTYSVRIPSIIRDSDNENKKAFVIGYLTFEKSFATCLFDSVIF